MSDETKKDTRPQFMFGWDGPLEQLMREARVKPVRGEVLRLRRYGALMGKYIFQDGEEEHEFDIMPKPMGGIIVACEDASVRPIYKALRRAEKFLRSRTEKRVVIRPVLPQSIYDLIESSVFDFFRAIDALETTRGFGNVGLIFTGPPGVGKSETMRWLRDESYATYKRGNIQIGLAELQKALSEGKPFNTHKALFFIDDIDANLLRDRKETQNPLTSQFLTCLDGLEKQEGRVMVISTNEQIDGKIDPALTRPGRFEHIVEFGYPSLDLITRFCQEREIVLDPIWFEGWSFARIDLFLAKLKVANFLHGTSASVYYEKFIHEMGQEDRTVEAYETAQSESDF